MSKADYQVFVTEDYSKFKKLDGNRDVTDMRVNKIKKSIEKIGYVHNPIVVNEKHEVIDGQGRLQALKELQMPVEYIIAPGTGINECREMNINMSNWTTKDYIESYADLGDISYIYLRNLYRRFSKISMKTIICAVNGNSAIGGDAIMKGKFECTPEDYEGAVEALEFIESIKPYIGSISGNLSLFMNALIFIYNNEVCDMGRVKSVIEKYIDKFGDCATIEQSLEYIEKYYNKYNHGELANFVYDYKVYYRKKIKATPEGRKKRYLQSVYGIQKD